MTESRISLLDRAQVETKLAEIWRIVLEVDAVGPEDDFYGLGGDSLNAVEMAAGVEMLLGVVIDSFEVLEHPVFKDFVAFLVRFIDETGQTITFIDTPQSSPLVMRGG